MDNFLAIFPLLPPGISISELAGIMLQHMEELAMDKRHFSARWLAAFKDKININLNLNLDQCTLANIIIFVFFVLMICTQDEAGIIANGILAFTPLMLMFLYPSEKLDSQILLVYYLSVAAVSPFDPLLEFVLHGGWYALKMVLFSLLFLRPFCMAEKIHLYLVVMGTIDGQQLEDQSRRAKKQKSQPSISSENVSSSARTPPSSVSSQSSAIPASTNTPASAGNGAQQQGGVTSHYINLQPQERPAFNDGGQSHYAGGSSSQRQQ